MRTGSRFHAHRSLATVILGWTTVRIIVLGAGASTVMLVPPLDQPSMLADVKGAAPLSVASVVGKTAKHSPIARAPPFLETGLPDDQSWIDHVKSRDRSNTPFEMISFRLLSPATDRAFIGPVQNGGRGQAQRPVRSIVPFASTIDQSALSAYGWIYLRQGSTGNSFAPDGQLGGSQAGLRVTYRLAHTATPVVALSGRVSRPLRAPSGGEAGLGADIRLSPQSTTALIVERRIALDDGGRDAFAAFVAGSLPAADIGHRWQMSGYFQTGVVGASRRDLFIDGAYQVERPVADRGEITAGIGVWGAAQPSVERIDAGPMLAGTVRIGQVPLHWNIAARIRVAGRADPPSGMAFTLSSGF